MFIQHEAEIAKQSHTNIYLLLSLFTTRLSPKSRIMFGKQKFHFCTPLCSIHCTQVVLWVSVNVVFQLSALFDFKSWFNLLSLPGSLSNRFECSESSAYSPPLWGNVCRSPSFNGSRTPSFLAHSLSHSHEHGFYFSFCSTSSSTWHTSCSDCLLMVSKKLAAHKVQLQHTIKGATAGWLLSRLKVLRWLCGAWSRCRAFIDFPPVCTQNSVSSIAHSFWMNPRRQTPHYRPRALTRKRHAVSEGKALASLFSFCGSGGYTSEREGLGGW